MEYSSMRHCRYWNLLGVIDQTPESNNSYAREINCAGENSKRGSSQ